MIVNHTSYEHALAVCLYHANPENERTDPVWAKRFLSKYINSNILVPEQANKIRSQCGWDVHTVQLELL